MIRNVLTIGKSSYAVTLPRSYVEEHQLSPGDQIHVSQQGNALTIQPQQPQHQLKADLSNVRRCSPEFVRRILHGYYLLGAEHVSLTNIPNDVYEQLRTQLRQPGTNFYEQEANEGELTLTCPERFTNQGSLQTLIKGFLQTLYKRLSDEQARNDACPCRIDVARRAISQNLSLRRHLALSSFVEKIILACVLTGDIQKTPDYLKNYAQITYHLQQYYLEGSVTQLEYACEQLSAREEENQQLTGQDRQYATQLHRHLTQATTDLFIYQSQT